MFKRSRKWFIGISLAIVIYVLGSIFFSVIGFVLNITSTLILGLILLIALFIIYKVVVINRKIVRSEKSNDERT